MNKWTFFLGLFLLSSGMGALFSYIDYLKKGKNEILEKYENERDCRLTLEFYVRRERGETIPTGPSGYSICDLDPLLERCLCD